MLRPIKKMPVIGAVMLVYYLLCVGAAYSRKDIPPRPPHPQDDKRWVLKATVQDSAQDYVAALTTHRIGSPGGSSGLRPGGDWRPMMSGPKQSPQGSSSRESGGRRRNNNAARFFGGPSFNDYTDIEIAPEGLGDSFDLVVSANFNTGQKAMQTIYIPSSRQNKERTRRPEMSPTLRPAYKVQSVSTPRLRIQGSKGSTIPMPPTMLRTTTTKKGVRQKTDENFDEIFKMSSSTPTLMIRGSDGTLIPLILATTKKVRPNKITTTEKSSDELDEDEEIEISSKRGDKNEVRRRKTTTTTEKSDEFDEDDDQVTTKRGRSKTKTRTTTEKFDDFEDDEISSKTGNDENEDENDEKSTSTTRKRRVSKVTSTSTESTTIPVSTKKAAKYIPKIRLPSSSTTVKSKEIEDDLDKSDTVIISVTSSDDRKSSTNRPYQTGKKLEVDNFGIYYHQPPRTDPGSLPTFGTSPGMNVYTKLRTTPTSTTSASPRRNDFPELFNVYTKIRRSTTSTTTSAPFPENLGHFTELPFEVEEHHTFEPVPTVFPFDYEQDEDKEILTILLPDNTTITGHSKITRPARTTTESEFGAREKPSTKNVTSGLSSRSRVTTTTLRSTVKTTATYRTTTVTTKRSTTTPMPSTKKSEISKEHRSFSEDQNEQRKHPEYVRLPGTTGSQLVPVRETPGLDLQSPDTHGSGPFPGDYTSSTVRLNKAHPPFLIEDTRPFLGPRRPFPGDILRGASSRSSSESVMPPPMWRNPPGLTEYDKKILEEIESSTSHAFKNNFRMSNNNNPDLDSRVRGHWSTMRPAFGFPPPLFDVWKHGRPLATNSSRRLEGGRRNNSEEAVTVVDWVSNKTSWDSARINSTQPTRPKNNRQHPLSSVTITNNGINLGRRFPVTLNPNQFMSTFRPPLNPLFRGAGHMQEGPPGTILWTPRVVGGGQQQWNHQPSVVSATSRSMDTESGAGDSPSRFPRINGRHNEGWGIKPFTPTLNYVPPQHPTMRKDGSSPRPKNNDPNLIQAGSDVQHRYTPQIRGRSLHPRVEGGAESSSTPKNHHHNHHQHPPDHPPMMTAEELAYILIGSCCLLSLLCLVVITVTMRCKPSSSDASDEDSDFDNMAEDSLVPRGNSGSRPRAHTLGMWFTGKQSIHSCSYSGSSTTSSATPNPHPYLVFPQQPSTSKQEAGGIFKRPTFLPTDPIMPGPSRVRDNSPSDTPVNSLHDDDSLQSNFRASGSKPAIVNSVHRATPAVELSEGSAGAGFSSSFPVSRNKLHSGHWSYVKGEVHAINSRTKGNDGVSKRGGTGPPPPPPPPPGIEWSANRDRLI